MKSEKGIATNDALENKSHEPTMNNSKPIQNKFQFSSRRSLLELTKLSRVPEWKPTFDLQSVPFPKQQPDLTVCVGCGGRLDRDDTFQQSIKVCRKCLVFYAKIDQVFEERAKRTRRELLEKIAGGMK